MQTNDRQISELMKSIESGSAQLPDFQRGWVWDDNRIKALIASITSNFPVGAAMFLEYGNANITKLRCPLLQQLAVSGGSQILTSGEHISRFVETQIGGKMLMAFS